MIDDLSHYSYLREAKVMVTKIDLVDAGVVSHLTELLNFVCQIH